MPDISMCANKGCPLNKDCYRFRAIPSKYQAYCLFGPILDEDRSYICEAFYAIRDGDKLQPLSKLFEE